MNPFQFVAEVAAAVAWPGAVVLIVLIFRKPIADLLGRIHKEK
jgi:hypothetical protein